MEREYFDAKFEGLEKLMMAHQDNTKNHISAVSLNVKAVSSELSEHKENADAHGLGAASKTLGTAVAWLGLGISALVALFEVMKAGH